MVEGLRGRAAVERSTNLRRRLPGPTYLTGFVTMALAILNLYLTAVMTLGFLTCPGSFLLGVAAWAGVGLDVVGNHTFFLVLVGALYLRLRAASSESIDDVLHVEYRREEVTGRRWQRRLDVSRIKGGSPGPPKSQ
jgi:hypothetical protein